MNVSELLWKRKKRSVLDRVQSEIIQAANNGRFDSRSSSSLENIEIHFQNHASR